MTRWNGFGRAVAFAAVAAAALLAAQILVAPLLGARATARGFALLAAVVYVAGLGPSWRRGGAAAVSAAVAAAALLVLPLSVPHTVAAAAAVIALCRSAILYRQRPLRALALETLIGAGALALAGYLAGAGNSSSAISAISAISASSAISLALAAWGFFLVQSVFFLVGGIEARSDPAGPADPFERARAELLALLD